MKNKKSLIIGLICSILITSTVFAKAYPLEKNISGSIYSPEREGVQYVQGELGFTFPSFNNFYDNPNIESGARNGEERLFTLAQHCEYDAATNTAPCGADVYQNYGEVIQDPLEEGDKVRFEVYFHNNGEDAYDGGTEGSADAINVNIGIDLEDIVIQASPLHLAPKGFIYADNNQYIVNASSNYRNSQVSNSGHVIDTSLLLKDENQNIIRIASDSAWMERLSEDLVLKPVPGSAALYIDTAGIDQVINGTTQITYPTPTGQQIINVTPYYDNEVMKLSFDRLPGCFRYSGFAYFEAVVERVPEEIEPVCEELLVDHHDPIYNGTYSRFNSSANDTDGNNFASDIRYWVDPGFGTLSLTEPTNVPINPAPYVFERVFQLLPIGVIQVQWSALNLVESTVAEAGLLDGLFGNVAHAITIQPYEGPEYLGGFDLNDLVFIGNTELIVPQGTPVYLTATQPGINGIFHAETVDSDVLTCARDFDIMPYEVCDDILVNHHETIIDDGNIAQFEAMSLNTLGNTFNGEITYSVDAGYGQFYETKPAGTDNASQYIVEFDASQPIAAPSAGWCADELAQGGGTDPYTTAPFDKFGLDRPLEPFIEIGPNDPIGPIVDDSGFLQDQIMGDWFWQGIDESRFGGQLEQSGVMQEGIMIDGAMLEGGALDIGAGQIDMGSIGGGLLQNSVLHAANAEVIDANTIRVEPGETVWFVPAQPGTDVIHVSADCTDVVDCSRDFSIENGPGTNECASLEITSSTQPLELSATLTTDLTVVGLDLNGDPLPDTTDLSWSTDTGATLTPLLATIADTVTANGFQTPGTISVDMADINDPLYSQICADSIPVTELLICTDLSVQDEGVELVELNPNELYELTADATYTGTTATEEVTYTSTQGLFFGPITTTNPLLIEAYRVLVNDNLVTTPISSNWMNEPIPSVLLAQLSQTITVNDGDLVFFVTFSDATGNDVLTVQATNRGEAACVKTYDMAVLEEPCESIQVTYSPSPFDSELSTVIVVEPGVYGDWTGEFEFSAPNGTFSVPGEADNTSFTQAETENGIAYAPSSATDTDEITITATGPLNGNGVCDYVISPSPDDVVCTDLSIVQPAGTWTEGDFTDDNEQRFRIEVDTSPSGFEDTLTYKWEEDNGSFRYGDTTDHTYSNPLINYLEDIDTSDDASVTVYAEDGNGDPVDACRDTVNFDADDDDDNPDIDKVVYNPDGDNSDKWENVVNYAGKQGGSLNSKYRWVTYLSVFDPDGVEEVQIWEDELDNNGNIVSDNIGSAGGFLEFAALLIAVEDNDGDQYIIYQTDSFERSRFNGDEDQILDEELNDFEDWDEDLDDLEDKYDCDDGSENNRVCIEDFEDTLLNFQRGKRIEFQNTEDTKAIYVFYQMDNRDTVIDEKFCEEMIEEYGTCGVEFVNEINFETPGDDGDYDDEDDNHEGKDEAKVIVICPYVLIREGGDIFFHDAIDTGIDISYCYEVEGGEGGTFTPKKEDDGSVVDTGDTGEVQPGDVQLIAGSHDLCKISNTNESDIDAYKNVFKNFSSSVCEMETEVAEDWKEVHINNAIKANIEKLARFGINPADANILEVENTLLLNNNVYIAEGNLTISDDFKVPAGARTYILQNGNLEINANVYYDDNSSKVDITNPTTIPSVAFVVIDGDIIIDPSVTHLDGIYMAVDTEGEEGEDGRFLSAGDEVSYELLTIQGSVVGDIFELYKSRKGVGDPLKDESSITVKYDQRILLNTAPGLNELIDISQLEVAN
jgi:hypothetical protein